MISASPLLVTLSREGADEIAIRGEIVVTDGKAILFQTAEILGCYPARSVLKPFQFLAGGLSLESWKGRAKYAACLGSTSANQAQVDQLKQWYDSSPEQALVARLQLPASFPMDERLRVDLKREGRGPEPIFHTCFSKHMGILAACRERGWESEHYLSADHPYHRNLMATLSDLLGEEVGGAPIVTDGCRLPTPVLTLAQIARLYQRLASAAEGTPLACIRALMLRYPEWIGGPGRADTKLMGLNAGRLVAKEGADGLFAVALLPSAEFPGGLGVVLKLAAGYLPHYYSLALRPLWERLGLKAAAERSCGHEAKFHYLPFQPARSRWIDISPTLTEAIAVWPEDRSFRRIESFSTHRGHPYSLSSIETTVHLGAHADAPCHFLKTTRGIDQVEVEKYIGGCQVIEVGRIPGDLIRPGHLEGTRLMAPRALFKTGSFPDPNRFNRDFTALSPDLVRWLAARGVALVGIDTPSIDPFDSKSLGAHHATAESGMAILEGIVLEKVPPGLYELYAAPLKIDSADASPVRALLRAL